MSRDRDADAADGGIEPDGYRPSLKDRLRNAVLKPAPLDAESTARATPAPLSLSELEAADKTATDKERGIGLLAAPLASAIGLLVINALINNDPPALLKNGQLNKAHVNVSIYHELLIVILALSVLMLVTSLLRKRLYLGIAMALYGLTVFNLHYWGFGIPFIMGAAWLMVRAFRLHRDWREATGDGPSYPDSRSRSRQPRSNKRYTRPSPRRTP